MKKTGKILLGIILAAVCISGCGEEKSPQKQDAKEEDCRIQVFIAASLGNAMEEIADEYAQVAPEVSIVFNAGSSGKLQTQIEEGGACDLFVSAAEAQMEVLAEKGFVDVADVVNLLENKVQLIKPKGEQTLVTGFENITNAADLALAAESVPVGQYARNIFENLGMTDKIMEMEINECEDVTAVLAAVSEGSNEVGIVYATDAMSAKDKVEVIATADEKILSTKVFYPAGLVKNEEADEQQKAAAKAFFAYLQSEDAAEVFEKYGFTVR